MRNQAEVLAQIRNGMLPAHIYNDADVYAAERDRIFPRSWLFVAHESEIPQNGDYVVRQVLDNSFIISRDRDGVIHALFNMCLHRGMQVCRAEQGNASHFRCPYHGWSYRNDGKLVGLPFHKDAYGGEAGFARKNEQLVPAAQIDTYNGLIFVNLDPDAAPLEEFLGDYTFYLDYYTKQSPSGVEVLGPQRWRVKANWKIGAENFVGDMYHTPHTHASIVEIGLFREPKASKRKEGAIYWATRGGGTTYKLPPGTLEERLAYVGYPAEMIERMKQNWSQEQLDVVGRDGFMVSASSVFPNLSLVHNWPIVAEGEDVVPFISLRQWQPISENETEVLSWFVVDKEAPEEFKERSYKAYLMCFGTSGMFEQDDIENWVSLTTTAGGTIARNLLLNGRMGLLPDNTEMVAPLPPDQFAGPGEARVGYGEHNQRAWLNEWANYLERPVAPIAPTAVGMPKGVCEQ